jgi:hypothetical protein
MDRRSDLRLEPGTSPIDSFRIGQEPARKSLTTGGTWPSDGANWIVVADIEPGEVPVGELCQYILIEVTDLVFIVARSLVQLRLHKGAEIGAGVHEGEHLFLLVPMREEIVVVRLPGLDTVHRRQRGDRN